MSDPDRLEPLWKERPRAVRGRGLPMPRELRDRYGGSLTIPLAADRPTVIANFVSTVDGVVALGPGEPPGGGPISGFFEPDRFVMALLRALADVFVVGSGTIAGTSSHDWTAERMAPAHAVELTRWRRQLGLRPRPTAVIVTGSGEVRLGKRGIDDPVVPVIFATTPDGAQRLRRLDLPSHVSIEALGSGERLSGQDLMAFLRTIDASLILCEGGPHLLGDLIDVDGLDELFLTVAPQIVGRGEGRLGLVEGVGLAPGAGRWLDLVSVRRSGGHLFLRYRRRRGDDA